MQYYFAMILSNHYCVFDEFASLEDKPVSYRYGKIFLIYQNSIKLLFVTYLAHSYEPLMNS